MVNIEEAFPARPIAAELLGTEAVERVGVVNSERRILALGAIGVLSDGDPRTAVDAYDDYISAVPGVERFFSVSNFRQAAREMPVGYVALDEVPAGTPLAEQKVGLTDAGIELAGLGGHLLDLSLRTNTALRALLGNTRRHVRTAKDGTPLMTPQERYLRLGATLADADEPQSVTDLMKADGLTTVQVASMHKLLRPWNRAKIAQYEVDADDKTFLWELSEQGDTTYRELLVLLKRFQENKASTVEQGLGIVKGFLTDPAKRRLLPHLFRRDYHALGSDEKGGVQDFANTLRRKLYGYENGSCLSTVELMDIVGGGPINTRSLHRLEWVLGADSPIAFMGVARGKAMWAVKPARRSPRAYYEQFGRANSQYLG